MILLVLISGTICCNILFHTQLIDFGAVKLNSSMRQFGTIAFLVVL